MKFTRNCLLCPLTTPVLMQKSAASAVLISASFEKCLNGPSVFPNAPKTAGEPELGAGERVAADAVCKFLHHRLIQCIPESRHHRVSQGCKVLVDFASPYSLVGLLHTGQLPCFQAIPAVGIAGRQASPVPALAQLNSVNTLLA